MRIRPRVLLAKYLVSSTVQFLDDEGSAYSSYILPGYDSKLIWFKRVWFKRVLLKLSEYTVSSYSAHGASCTLSIWFSLHLRREIHGVGSNGMWWTYWVSKGAMDSVHVRTRPHQSLRIHRIRDSAHSASCTLTRKPYLSAFTYDEKYMEWVPMGCGGHIG